MKIIILIAVFGTLLCAKENIKSLQYAGVKVKYQNRILHVEREQHIKCLNIGITAENVFGGNMADETLPKECKKSFASTLGVVQPMVIDEKIKTIGELEVLKIMKSATLYPQKYAIVDARKKLWFEMLTLPLAINISHDDIAYDEHFPNEYVKNLKLLNITKDKYGELDFSKAKEIVIFCNGSWCVQSVRAIYALVKLGYPKKKLLWYRGGLQDWSVLGFTTVKGMGQ